MPPRFLPIFLGKFKQFLRKDKMTLKQVEIHLNDEQEIWIIFFFKNLKKSKNK